MTEQNKLAADSSVASTAGQPIQDKTPKPPGLMPKNIQAWVMLGLAVLMVIIMWLTGGKKAQTAPKSGTSTTQTPAPLEVNQAKITDLQNRIQELQREQQTALNQQNKLFTALQSEAQTSSPAQVSDPQSGAPSASDPIREERRKRAYLSLFSSNVALTYRKDLLQAESAVTNNPSISQNQPGQQPTFDQQLSQILQTLPPMPQPVAPAQLVSGSARQAGTTTTEEAEKKASESASKQSSPNPSALNAADGKNYVIFEG